MPELDVTKLGGRNGTYSLFIDESQLPALPEAQPLYCMVIQSKSKNAPVNTIVRCDNVEEFRATFGNRDQSQERKGNYSMLLAELMFAAQNQAMYFLNLREYDDAQTTQLVSLNTSNLSTNPTGVHNIQYKMLYDRTNLWQLDRENFVTEQTNGILNFVAIRSNNVTLYVRSAKTLPGVYDETVGEHKERYPKIDIPHLPDQQLIRDLFVEVYVFDRDLTSSVATQNAELSRFIDSTSALKSDDYDVLEELSKVKEAKFVKKFVGCITPEILTVEGDSNFIESIVNASAKQTGVGLKVNLEALHEYDDWDIETSPMPYIVSYNAPNLASSNTEIPADNSLSYDLDVSDLTSNEAVEIQSDYDFTTLDADAILTNYQDGVASAQFDDWNVSVDEKVGFLTESVTYATEAFGNPELAKNQFLTLGRNIIIPSQKKNISRKLFDKDNFKVVTASGLTDITGIQFIGYFRKDAVIQSSDVVIDPVSNIVYPQRYDDITDTYIWIYPATHATTAGQDVTFTAGVADDAASSGTPLGQPSLSPAETEQVMVNYSQYISVHKITTRDVLNVPDYPQGGNTTNVKLYNPTDRSEVIFDDTMLQDIDVRITLVRTSEHRAVKYKSIALRGVELNANQFCDGTAGRQNQILDMLNSDTFRNGMLDTERYGFKILVDGFETYIEPVAKQQLSRLAADSGRYVFIGSLPFHKSFDKSKNPYFKESAIDVVNPKFIVSGGNKDLPFTNTWSMPNTEELGDWAAGFFSSNLVYGDGVTDTVLPGGPIVALNYGLNFIRNDRHPYDPVGAEDNGGIINVPGVESLAKDYAFSERNVLEPAGYNLIISNSAGELVIYNNQSAKQSPRSALSSLENAFLVFHVADGVFRIIKPAVFKRNTYELREEMKLKADQFCDKLVTNGAISRYVNICDETNNTKELRAQGYFVLDTELYTITGIRIAVHRTIVKSEIND